MSGHGGKRRRHLMPALSPGQVQHLRMLRADRVPYKVLQKMTGLSRETLSHAVLGKGTYEGYCMEKKMMSTNVYMLDDCDWWAGDNLADVLAEARSQCGADAYEGAETQAHALSDEELKRLIFVEEDGAKRTFYEELQRQIESGAKFPLLFASTEY